MVLARDGSGDGPGRSPGGVRGRAIYHPDARTPCEARSSARCGYLQQPVELPIKSKWPPMTAFRHPRTVNFGTPSPRTAAYGRTR